MQSNSLQHIIAQLQKKTFSVARKRQFLQLGSCLDHGLDLIELQTHRESSARPRRRDIALRTCRGDINCWRRCASIMGPLAASDCTGAIFETNSAISCRSVALERASRPEPADLGVRVEKCERARATKLSLTDGNQTRQLMIMPLDRSRTERERERGGRQRRTDGGGRGGGGEGGEGEEKEQNERENEIRRGRRDETDRTPMPPTSLAENPRFSARQIDGASGT